MYQAIINLLTLVNFTALLLFVIIAIEDSKDKKTSMRWGKDLPLLTGDEHEIKKAPSRKSPVKIKSIPKGSTASYTFSIGLPKAKKATNPRAKKRPTTRKSR